MVIAVRDTGDWPLSRQNRHIVRFHVLIFSPPLSNTDGPDGPCAMPIRSCTGQALSKAKKLVVTSSLFLAADVSPRLRLNLPRISMN